MSSEVLDLSMVTYLCVLPSATARGDNNIEAILKIGHETSKDINFYNKIVYTPQKADCETYDFEVREIENIDFHEYTPWLLKNSKHLFDSSFMINFHSDGMIQNPRGWEDSFLNYDYLGAPWNGSKNGGNGGFSLRSKYLCDRVSEIDLSSFDFEPSEKRVIANNEDVVICTANENELKIQGVKFAPLEINSKFSTEHFACEDTDFYNSFGFHEIETLFNANVKQHRRKFLQNILT